jgi:hypothetical protein
VTGATSRTQCPNVPNVTEECRMWVWFVSITFKMAMSPITGAEIVVTRSRIAEKRIRMVPIQWSQRNMITVV